MVVESNRLNVRVPDHLVKSLRVVSSLEGKSMASVVEEILAPELERRERLLLSLRSEEIEQSEATGVPRIGPRGRPRKKKEAGS